MRTGATWGLGALAVVASAIGCAALIGLEPADQGSGGAGTSSSTSSGSSGSSTSSGSSSGTTSGCNGGVACTSATSCTPPTTKCLVAACTGGCCGTSDAAMGTACSDGGGTVCDGNGKCVSAHCTDGVKDGDETDVDCGGATCAGCADGKMCLVGTDCADKVCDPTAKTCSAPTCSDGVQNGTETDVDCGGNTCDGQGDTCATGKKCGVNGDCATGDCQGGVCAQKSNGTVCTAAAQCASGACLPDDSMPVIDVCCAASCAATNEGSCGSNGNCKHDGSGCALWPSGTACGQPSCNGTVYTPPGGCNGAGSCSAATAAPCPNGFACASGTQCATGCPSNDTAGDALCASGYWCNGFLCQQAYPGMVVCTRSSQCQLGTCVPSDGGGSSLCM